MINRHDRRSDSNYHVFWASDDEIVVWLWSANQTKNIRALFNIFFGGSEVFARYSSLTAVNSSLRNASFVRWIFRKIYSPYFWIKIFTFTKYHSKLLFVSHSPNEPTVPTHALAPVDPPPLGALFSPKLSQMLAAMMVKGQSTPSVIMMLMMMMIGFEG